MAERVRVGILGVGESGSPVIEAVRRCACAELVAVADREQEVASRQGRVLGVASFDDFRSFLLAQPLDAVLVAAPPFQCHEVLRLAASRRIPIWRVPPLARRFEEAGELVQLFAETSTPLVVGRLWEDQAGWLEAGALRDALGTVFLLHALVVVRRDDALDWRGDAERAGGGVLLNQGYEAVDMCGAMMGVPDRVTAATARTPRDPAGRLRYDTEDTACVLMQYGSEGMASVTMCWRAEPSTRRIDVYGERGSLTIDGSRLTHRSPDGREVHATEIGDDDLYVASVTRFLKGLAGGSASLEPDSRKHLETTAVIEAAYLSARTGEPEAPLRLLEMQGWLPDEVP